jgi:hypothetical protein
MNRYTIGFLVEFLGYGDRMYPSYIPQPSQTRFTPFCAKVSVVV